MRCSGCLRSGLHTGGTVSWFMNNTDSVLVIGCSGGKRRMSFSPRDDEDDEDEDDFEDEDEDDSPFDDEEEYSDDDEDEEDEEDEADSFLDMRQKRKW